MVTAKINNQKPFFLPIIILHTFIKRYLYISHGGPYIGFNCCVQRMNVARLGNSRNLSAPV